MQKSGDQHHRPPQSKSLGWPRVVGSPPILEKSERTPVDHRQWGRIKQIFLCFQGNRQDPSIVSARQIPDGTVWLPRSKLAYPRELWSREGHQLHSRLPRCSGSMLIFNRVVSFLFIYSVPVYCAEVVRHMLHITYREVRGG